MEDLILEDKEGGAGSGDDQNQQECEHQDHFRTAPLRAIKNERLAALGAF